nr:reverse transcriptase [Tanacetum cinerariifolium]
MPEMESEGEFLDEDETVVDSGLVDLQTSLILLNALTEGAQLVNIRPYKHPPTQKDAIEGMVTHLLEAGVIKKSNSTFSSHIVMVKKTIHGEYIVEYLGHVIYATGVAIDLEKNIATRIQNPADANCACSPTFNAKPTYAELTLSNRGDPKVLKAVTKPITHIEGWKEMDFMSFMMEGVDGEFHFLLKGGAEPLTVITPSQFAKNVVDSDDALSDKMKLFWLTTWLVKRETCQKTHKVPPQASKVPDEPSDPLDIDSDLDIHEFPSAKELKDFADCHWVVAHVTPPLWKQHLKEIIMEKLYDIYEKAYMWQAALDNVMNRRTLKLMST